MVKRTQESFLSRAAKTVQSLTAAAESRDYTKLRTLAHSLKGACGYVASDRLRASSFRLQLAAEAAGRGDAPDSPVEECLSRLLTDLSLVCAAIEQALATEVSAAAPPTPTAPSVSTPPASAASSAMVPPAPALHASIAVAASPPPSATSLLDVRKMRDSLGSSEMVKRTQESFLSRAAKTVQSLTAAAESRDYTKLRTLAHSLKGACGYVASDRLRASSFRLQLAAEAAGRGDAPDSPVEECLSRLLTDLSLVCEAIEQALRPAPAPLSPIPNAIAALSIS